MGSFMVKSPHFPSIFSFPSEHVVSQNDGQGREAHSMPKVSGRGRERCGWGEPREGSKVTPHLLGLESIQGAWCWHVTPKDKWKGVCSLGSGKLELPDVYRG